MDISETVSKVVELYERWREKTVSQEQIEELIGAIDGHGVSFDDCEEAVRRATKASDTGYFAWGAFLDRAFEIALDRLRGERQQQHEQYKNSGDKSRQGKATRPITLPAIVPFSNNYTEWSYLLWLEIYYGIYGRNIEGIAKVFIRGKQLNDKFELVRHELLELQRQAHTDNLKLPSQKRSHVVQRSVYDRMTDAERSTVERRP